MSILSVGNVKSISEFASDLADAVEKNKDLIAAAKSLAPDWLDAVSESAAESLPLIKFFAKLAEKLVDPPTSKELALLACTLAFQKAVADALSLAPQTNKIPLTNARAKVQTAAAAWRLDDPAIMTGFSLEHPASHPFVLAAITCLHEPITMAGYDDAEARIIDATIYETFKDRLRELVSDPKLKDRFAPFVQWAQLGSEEERAYFALQDHAARQRNIFRQESVLGNEPFALSDVYVETDCGELEWRQIHTDKLDPFDEHNGGRAPLLETVLRYIGLESFNDAIVIQGGPGAGKSAFTLKLSDELLRLGLLPIRIRLRNLRIDLPLLKAVAQAVVSLDSTMFDLRKIPRPKDALLEGRVFDEPANLNGTQISRYLLILDGWDEVSTAERGYQIQVAELLQRVRREFLEGRAPLVRVVLTGRPSEAIGASNFLNDDTPILTVRPYTPVQLNFYMDRLRRALDSRASLAAEDKNEASPERWSLPPADHFRAAIEQYGKSPNRFEVLGQPLLAHLAVRVMAETRSKEELEDLITTPTRLYRSLVDMTCGKAGKAAQDRSDDPQQARIRGLELRRKLHKTAAAITAYGQESIPFRELTLRAAFKSEEQQDLTDTSRRDRPWTKLMLSFYFKGGTEHQGCEFLHKSFREYLFAEGIIETLKEHARQQESAVALRRQAYWKDFDKIDADQRYDLSRALGELLSPQWLSTEVIAHLDHLIPWEISRLTEANRATLAGTPTEYIPLNKWEVARDLLAALWEWWAEGSHLRPQPRRSEDTGDITLRPPYADQLVNLAMLRDRSGDKALPVPIRTTTVDGHLGDGLFRLSALVHYFVSRAQGWTGEWGTTHVSTERPYQVSVTRSERTFWMFSPAGPDFANIAYYFGRIQAVGWSRQFPAATFMKGIWLPETCLVSTVAWCPDGSAAGAHLRLFALNKPHHHQSDPWFNYESDSRDDRGWIAVEEPTENDETQITIRLPGATGVPPISF